MGYACHPALPRITRQPAKLLNPPRPARFDPGTQELLTVSPYILVYEVDPLHAQVFIRRTWHMARDR
jgi:hypothetical protein